MATPWLAAPAAAGPVPPVAQADAVGADGQDRAPRLADVAGPLAPPPPAGDRSAAAEGALRRLAQAGPTETVTAAGPSGRDPADGPPPSAGGEILNELAAAIARATTQGALRVAPGRETGVPPNPGDEAAPATANIRLRLPGEEAWLPETATAEMGCPPEDDFDVAAWGAEGAHPASAIAGLRARLSEDVDAIDEGQALALARLYVSLGFGAEARAMVDATVPRDPSARLLSAMSLIVDGDPAPAGVFEPLAACSGRAQMWVALATGRPGTPEAVTLAVSELPLALRRQVGPRLIETYLGAGDAATAEAIRAAVERAAGPHGTPFELAAARIEIGRDTMSDLEPIRSLAARTAPSSDDALALLLETANDRGEAVEAASLAQAGTRADDLRGTPAGVRLLTALVRAHLRRDSFDEAALRLASGGAPPETERALAGELFLALAERGEDDQVLVLATALREPFSRHVRHRPAGPAIAERLLGLGLADVARDYMPADDGSPASTLAIRVELASGEPAAALARLDRISAPTIEHMALRAEALHALGRDDEALEIRRRINAHAGGTAPVATRPGAATDEVPDPRASLRDLVGASAQARQEIDALLSAASAP
jgi:hypothetical protein